MRSVGCASTMPSRNGAATHGNLLSWPGKEGGCAMKIITLCLLIMGCVQTKLGNLHWRLTASPEDRAKTECYNNYKSAECDCDSLYDALAGRDVEDK